MQEMGQLLHFLTRNRRQSVHFTDSPCLLAWL